MQISSFIMCFTSGHLYLGGRLNTALTAALHPLCATLSSIDAKLYFNPIKLAFLIAWVYLCLYIVQRIQFSSLVPKSYKAIASVVALFAGPILLFALVAVDTARLVSHSRSSVFEVIKQQLKSIVANIRSSGFVRQKEDSRIQLLDSSGTELKDIYTDGKSKHEKNPIIDLTEQIIWNALEDRASDILIDPKDVSNYTVRYRVDGVLRIVYEIRDAVCKAVINSIKALSSMDIAEKRRPQDGSFMARKGETTTSFRVASAGVRNGEKLSIRILSQDAGAFTLANIGVSKKHRQIIKNIIAKPSGMILMCGPTGSGKTTTLYAMLNEIDLFTRNVITVEDPIECTIACASQIEVNPKADITFANTLRSILRQDPDVICVGEIRDKETAAIALQASQTGHLVLATIHCDSNAAALIRLLDLGISPILMSSGLSVLVSQRLLRRLCSNCKRPAELSENQIHDFHKKGINYANIFQAHGCRRCDQTGYRGRIAICDVLVLTDQMKTGIANSTTLIATLRETGDKKGRSGLHKQGLKKVVSGITSLDELKRVVG